jgi:hypothetical protein
VRMAVESDTQLTTWLFVEKRTHFVRREAHALRVDKRSGSWHRGAASVDPRNRVRGRSWNRVRGQQSKGTVLVV